MINFGEAHLARVGTHRLELLFQYGRSLYAEFQTACVCRHAQRFVGRQLFHAVVPIGQAGDVLVFHGLEQALSGWAQLEAVNGIDVVEQKGQVKQLDLFGVLLELCQRWRDDLHVPEQQCFHFLAVTE
ncbi:hypothetical protein D3C79_951820 [compost metagenome]